MSNRFKTDADREWHRKAQREAKEGYEVARIKHFTEKYGLTCKPLSTNVVRLSDGNKRLDLYSTRYFKVDTGERGNIRDEHQLILDYFNL